MNFQIIFAYYCMIYDSVRTCENQVTGFYMKCNRELNGSNNLQIWQKFKKEAILLSMTRNNMKKEN